MQKQEIPLKVMEAHQEEAYRGIVRIDSETMNLIGIGPGDIIEIEGGRLTVAITNRAYPSDVGQKVIRMDGILRRNAKTGIGETVKVRKADILEAKSITIAPAQKGVMVQAHPDVFKRGLLGRAVVKGDIVSLGGARSRRRTLAESPFFEDIFNVFEEGFMGNFGFGSLRFIVAETSPKQAVIITEATKININPKAVEVTEELIPEVTYEDIGGLDKEILSIREMVELPLRHPEIFKRLGIEPPAGVLLHGHPGTGKTLLAKAVANESEANFILINGPEIMNKYYGECVSADSLVLTNGSGLTTIEEAINSGNSHKIAGLDMNSRKIKMLPVSETYDKYIQNTLTVSTKNNSLTLTPTSRLLTKENNESKWIFAKDLKIGDKVALAKDWPKRRINNKILWSHIKNIEDSKAHVYDFTVPKDHNFIANGFIVHNSEKRVRDVFDEAEKNAPSIIFIDEIDAIAPKREETHGELERRVVATILTQMDGLKSRGNVVVIGATNRPNSIDPALRRPGRFDREIVIGIPDKKGRLEILKVHTRNMPLADTVSIKDIANITHGFVGADLSALAKEAAMSVLRRLLPEIKLREKEPIPKEVLDKLIITEKDFKEALRLVRPSAMREILVEVPTVHWKEVGGLDIIKQELIEAVEWPLKHSAAFKRLGIKPPKGILLYGPPGTGKTMLAKAVATESEANFIQVKGPELLNKFVGETEKGVRKIFEKARQTAPTIIFFDELDSIVPRRGLDMGTKVTERVVNTILAEIDGLEDLNDIVVIGASVTGDTPILVNEKGEIKLIEISKFIDRYYKKDEENVEKPVNDIEVLGFDKLSGKKIKGTRFKNSAFKKVRSVFRHKVNEIYEIKFIGGKIKATGNHSLFVRTKRGVEFKPVSQLKEGEYLVDLPYKARTTNKYENLRAHKFREEFNLSLPVYKFNPYVQQDYEFSLSSPLSQNQIALQIGVVQSTISNWKNELTIPRELSLNYFKYELPDHVPVNLDLMRLFGYYVAEGYARKEIDFCFNVKEKDYIRDVKSLMNNIFGLKPHKLRKITKNAINMVYYSKPLANFFIRHCGKGAKNKHLPSFLFETPREYFLEFLKGYIAGDGHKTKTGKTELTSVSKQLIMELNWLCRMHGIKTSISQFVTKPERIISGRMIDTSSTAFRLLVAKSSNPFIQENIKPMSSRAKIKSIKKVPYSGYVYDFCGCENEAFFGGETPILLHNTNRPDMIDTALLRPGRFDRILLVNVPDEKARLEILKIHTAKMPLTNDVDIKRLAKETSNYTGSDIQSLCREAAMLALRDDIRAKETTMKYFELALEKVKPSLREEDIDRYKIIEDKYIKTARGAAIQETPSYLG